MFKCRRWTDSFISGGNLLIFFIIIYPESIHGAQLSNSAPQSVLKNNQEAAQCNNHSGQYDQVDITVKDVQLLFQTGMPKRESCCFDVKHWLINK